MAVIQASPTARWRHDVGGWTECFCLPLAPFAGLFAAASPCGFATWLVGTVAHAAAEDAAGRHGARVLVLPTLPFGPTPGAPRLRQRVHRSSSPRARDGRRARVVLTRGPGVSPAGGLARLRWPRPCARPLPTSVRGLRTGHVLFCPSCRTTPSGAVSAIPPTRADTPMPSPPRWRRTCSRTWCAAR